VLFSIVVFPSCLKNLFLRAYASSASAAAAQWFLPPPPPPPPLAAAAAAAALAHDRTAVHGGRVLTNSDREGTRKRRARIKRETKILSGIIYTLNQYSSGVMFFRFSGYFSLLLESQTCLFFETPFLH
jgi:hypothetical protein